MNYCFTGFALLLDRGYFFIKLKEDTLMAGPICLFDKSFLQSLALDEAIWFDHFDLTVLCPIYYIETLYGLL